MMSDRKFWFMLAAVVTTTILVFVGALLWFQMQLNFNLNNSTHKILTEITEQQKCNLKSKIDYQFETVRTIANVVSLLGKNDLDVIYDVMELSAKQTFFSKFELIDTSGNAVIYDNSIINIRQQDFFHQVLNGKNVFSKPYWSESLKLVAVTLAVPIYKHEKVVGVLSGSYPVQELDKLFIEPFFDGKGYACIIDQKGDIIANTQNDCGLSYGQNLFEMFSQSLFEEHDFSQRIKQDMSNNLTGFVKYSKNDELFLASYESLGTNDWYVFCVVPEAVVSDQVIRIAKNTYFLTNIIILIFVILILFIVISRKRHIKELSQIAFIDHLTGAPNRKKFEIVATEFLNSSNNNQYAFIIIDIDKFKVLNDTLGYNCGDILLINIVNVLTGEIKDKEFFGRCDSDEYFLLLKYTNNDALKTRMEGIIGQVINKFKQNTDNGYNLVLCAGVYVIMDKAEFINSIIDKAKHAHGMIKGNQESTICFYDEKIRDQILEEKIIENNMHAALLNNEFILHLQPKYYLNNEKIYGAEALVRWNNGKSVIAYPDEFIPVFEKNGFITKIDMYMLEKVCQTINNWIDIGIVPIPVSINFSRLHLRNRNFVDDIASIVEKYKISPQLIEIELTESTMLHNEIVLIKVLDHLHEHGFTLSMDDFGSGYSSLGLLKNLSVDVIKLDKTFFTQYNDLPRAKTVISSMIAMAKKLGIRTVAEGVETRENIELLKELGCDIVQGYYYAKPMPVSDLNKLLGNIDGNAIEST